jgi:O-antigen/teichoic acid export membrane protein
MSVKAKKIVGGIGWVTLISHSNRLLGFLTTLILAKLLTPNDFGIVAIAMVFIQVLHIFKDMGLSQALIYRKEEIKKASQTVFWIILLLNVCIFLIAIAVSFFAAEFYNNTLVKPVIILLASNLIWNGLRAVPISLLKKELEFKKLIIPDILPVVIASIVSIILAYKGFGVWSLVVRSLLVSIGGSVFIWRFTKFRPSFDFDFKIAKELIHYGRYILGSTVIFVVLYNIDQFYVSKFCGIAALGFYGLSLRIANIPITEFSHLIGSVMFPVFSKINKEIDHFRKTFLKTIKYCGMISIPMALGLSVYGPELVIIIYGEKWAPMAQPLSIISLYAMFRAMSTIIHDAFKAIGRPEIMQKYAMIRLLIVGIGGIPALKLYGLNGICLLITVTYFCILIFEIITICNILSLKLSLFFNSIIKILVSSIILIPGIYFIIITIYIFYYNNYF